ncbi:hypothetical protein U9M48_018036 [Paspalum notatum var. saurae]|uniref:Uncharacterized protein n=1 Tax=Paspalum notatum var. saurae TaxID=547442 RepID=A0AAQ3TB12_PASNO
MCGRRRVGSHSAREWGRGAPPRSRSAWGPVAGGRRACAGPRCRRPTHASIGPLAAVFLDVAATRWLPCRLLRWSPPFSQCRRPCRSVPTAEWLGGGPAITRCSGLLSRPSRSGLPPRSCVPGADLAGLLACWVFLFVPLAIPAGSSLLVPLVCLALRCFPGLVYLGSHLVQRSASLSLAARLAFSRPRRSAAYGTPVPLYVGRSCRCGASPLRLLCFTPWSWLVLVAMTLCETMDVKLGPARNETQDLNKLRAIHYAQDAIRGKQLLLYSRENNT